MKTSKAFLSKCAVLLALLLVQFPSALLAAETAPAKNSLWKVEGKNNTVYLLGSIHFLKKEFYPLAEPIEAAYKNSRIAAFEADLAALEEMQTQLKMLQRAQLPPGETIQQHLSKETYQLLHDYLEDTVGIGGMFDQFRPWFAAMALSVIEVTKLGFDPSQGIDKHFYTRAKADGKKIVPLETVDFQLELLSGFAKEDQEALMKQTLQDVRSFKTIFADLIDAWKNGDAAKLDGLILDHMKGSPEIHQKLLIDRNHQWLKKIEGMLSGKENAFVVVGAGHLVGKESVVDLLQKKGFKVIQQ
jgi:uncharacterized protein